MIPYEKLLNEYKRLSIETYYYQTSYKSKTMMLSEINNLLKTKDDNILLEINNILNIDKFSLHKLQEEKNKYLTYIQIFNRILASDYFNDIDIKYMNEFVKRKDYFIKCILVLDNQIILYEGIERLIEELDK
jgi:hypothetical protein